MFGIKNYRKVCAKTLLVKAMLYRLCSIVIFGTLFRLFFDTWQQALFWSLLLELTKTVSYFIYDYIFTKLVHVTHNKGYVLWFTGLPCSGKTTVADALAKRITKIGGSVERLDGDMVRQSLTSDLGFSAHDRAENLKRVTFVAQLLSRNGVATLCTFVSPFIDVRNKIRDCTTNFIEVYVKCSVEQCVKRDVKGMYKLANEGKIKGFTGIDDPYEPPLNPEVIIDTEHETIKESVDAICNYLCSQKLL